jgi:hypothetical protein
MTSPCDVVFELLCFCIEHNDNIQGVPQKVNPFKFKSAMTYCSSSLMRHKWQPRSQALPSCGGKKYTGFSGHEYWILELLPELGIYLANICLCLCSFCCKGILELTLYFIYFAPSAHLIQSWNLFQTSNFNNAHFRIQYRTRFIQYCTKCAILHTKIGPVYFNHASEVQL